MDPINRSSLLRVISCMKSIFVLGLLTWTLSAQTLGEPYFLARFTQGDASAIQPYRDANAEVNVIGIESITGETQTWLLEEFPSFAAVEALDKLVAGARPVSARRMIGLYRTALSYRPDEAIKLIRSARYFQITVFRIRPGADVDFSELIRMRKTAFDSINLDRPEIGYQIISGTHSGTYIFVAPLNTLRTLDNTFARMPANSESLGSGRSKESRQIQWEADITREHMLFRVHPSLSHVTDAFAAGDPDFWRGR
jgi:hypothetical protein